MTIASIVLRASALVGDRVEPDVIVEVSGDRVSAVRLATSENGMPSEAVTVTGILVPGFVDVHTTVAAAALQDGYFKGGTAVQLIGSLATRPDGLLVSAETVKDFQLKPGDLIKLRLQDGTTKAARRSRAASTARPSPCSSTGC